MKHVSQNCAVHNTLSLSFSLLNGNEQYPETLTFVHLSPCVCVFTVSAQIAQSIVFIDTVKWYNSDGTAHLAGLTKIHNAKRYPYASFELRTFANE